MKFTKVNHFMSIAFLILLVMSGGPVGEKSAPHRCSAQRIMMIQVNPGSMVRLSSNSLSSLNRRGGRQRQRIRMMQPTVVQLQ